MLTITDLKNVLISYNLNTKYGPTIYKDDYKIGLALDIKDTTFGYLTRYFTFDNLEEVDTFLKKYTTYKKSNLINLSFDDYLSPNPSLIYTYQLNELSLNDMLKLTTNFKSKDDLTTIYIENINNLTKYLINLLENNYHNANLKNTLKITENDLKYNLVQALATYYGKTKTTPKKDIPLKEATLNTSLINELNNNLTNISKNSLSYLETYLQDLITKIKQEEYFEQNIINIYSIKIYNYNIAILNKQIAFVNSKIASEKNFNIKGSKIHNIDAELKSFLKNADAPLKYDIFLKDYQNDLNTKYNNLNLKNASEKITGISSNIIKGSNPKEYLNTLFNSLDKESKAALVLYNSIFKQEINYLIDANFPPLDSIKEKLSSNYELLDEIVHLKESIPYLKDYFYLIDFKNLDTYLNSLINLAKIITTINMTTNIKLTAFTLNKTNTYQELSLNPIYDVDTCLITISPLTNIIYVNASLEIDYKNKEINLIRSENLYYKGNIILKDDYLSINKFLKNNQKDKKNGIIITKELKLLNTYNFRLGETHE